MEEYRSVPVTHKVTLGEIVDLLEEFKNQPVSLMMLKCLKDHLQRSYLVYT